MGEYQDRGSTEGRKHAEPFRAFRPLRASAFNVSPPTKGAARCYRTAPQMLASQLGLALQHGS